MPGLIKNRDCKRAKGRKDKRRYLLEVIFTTLFSHVILSGIGDVSKNAADRWPVRYKLRHDDVLLFMVEANCLHRGHAGSGLMQSFTVVACHASTSGAAWSWSEFRILIILQQATQSHLFKRCENCLQRSKPAPISFTITNLAHDPSGITTSSLPRMAKGGRLLTYPPKLPRLTSRSTNCSLIYLFIFVRAMLIATIRVLRALMKPTSRQRNSS